MPQKLVIPKEFFETSNAWGARACLRLLGVPLVLIALLPFLAKISPWLAIATIAPLGIAISKTTLLVHEAVHGTLFRTPLLNRIAGRVGGWWTVVDFIAFDALHRKHHARVGQFVPGRGIGVNLLTDSGSYSHGVSTHPD